MENLGSRIKAARKKKGLTQNKLGELSNLSTMSIRRYESGERTPDVDQLQNIANALAVSIWELHGVDEKTARSSAFVHSLIGDLDDKEEDYPGELEETEKNAAIVNEVDSLKYGKKKILNDYNALNAVGKKEAEKRVEELTEIKKYTE